jgi:adenylosuccinate lyase
MLKNGREVLVASMKQILNAISALATHMLTNQCYLVHMVKLQAQLRLGKEMATLLIV